MENIHKKRAIELMNLINGSKISLEDWENTTLFAKKYIKRKVELVVKEIQNEIYIFYGGDNIDYCKERFSFYEKVLIELNLL